MTGYDIELGQGDIEEVCVVLKQKNVAIDLTSFTVNFTMEDDSGTKTRISCTKGYTDYSTTPETVYSETDGYVTIPFTDVSGTTNGGEFTGQLKATATGSAKLFPLGSPLSIKVWEAL